MPALDSSTKSNKVKLPKGIYGITDPGLLPDDTLRIGVEAALKGGCRTIQYRNKHADFDLQVQQARMLKQLCQHYNACFIVNDSVELARLSNADGVHLGKADDAIITARQQLGGSKIIGVTCHSDIAYAQDCIKQGVDYCAFGRFFSSLTKPEAPQSALSLLKDIALLPVPTLAIGGITIDNMQLLMDTPLHSIAVIHSLFGQPDIEEAARRLTNQFLSLS